MLNTHKWGVWRPVSYHLQIKNMMKECLSQRNINITSWLAWKSWNKVMTKYSKLECLAACFFPNADLVVGCRIKCHLPIVAGCWFSCRFRMDHGMFVWTKENLNINTNLCCERSVEAMKSNQSQIPMIEVFCGPCLARRRFSGSFICRLPIQLQIENLINKCFSEPKTLTKAYGFMMWTKHKVLEQINAKCPCLRRLDAHFLHLADSISGCRIWMFWFFFSFEPF